MSRKRVDVAGMKVVYLSQKNLDMM